MTDFDSTTSTDTETTSTPVPTTAIQPPSSGTPARNSRVRWLAAGVLIALVAAVTGLAAIALTSSKSTSAVLGYVPTDSVAYGELRLDLPGDQRQEVGEFLSKFPGFADQAALDTKLDEILDRLVSEGSDGKQTYSQDVKPWFGGQMGFAAGPIDLGSADASAARPHRGLLLLSVKDAALASSWLSSALQEAGATGTQQTYNGAQLTVFAAPKMPQEQAAFSVVDGKVALVGDLASVKAAVDTKGSSALARGDAVKAAQDSVTGDSLGVVFVDLKAILDATTEIAASAAPAGSMPPLPTTLTKLVPDWAAARVRVEGDALRLDSVAQHKEGTPGPDENRANAVTGFAPPSTIALLAGNDYGATLQETLELYENDPALKSAYEQIDRLAGMLGGLDAVVGWMGDTGVVVNHDGETVEGGLVSVPADAAQARQLFTTLRSFAQLAGQQTGITITDETYNGQTITVIDLGDLNNLAAMAGALGGGSSQPVQPSGLPGGDVKIAYVANDQVVAIGSSVDFVKHVLDAGAGASLADDARFQSLLGRVDAKHSSVSFIDVAAIRGVVEGLMTDASAKDKAEYEESVKPFLSPFDALIGTGVVSNSTDQMHTVITVK
jgi:hypothetical protein